MGESRGTVRIWTGFAKPPIMIVCVADIAYSLESTGAGGGLWCGP